jgi:hypothetical protein
VETVAYAGGAVTRIMAAVHTVYIWSTEGLVFIDPEVGVGEIVNGDGRGELSHVLHDKQCRRIYVSLDVLLLAVPILLPLIQTQVAQPRYRFIEQAHDLLEVRLSC